MRSRPWDVRRRLIHEHSVERLLSFLFKLLNTQQLMIAGHVVDTDVSWQRRLLVGRLHNNITSRQTTHIKRRIHYTTEHQCALVNSWNIFFGWLVIAKILLLQHNQYFYLDVSVSIRDLHRKKFVPWQRPKCQGKNVGCVEVIIFLH